MPDSLAASYDEMPYMNRAFPQSHPDRLATLATLFGLTPADLETCRVLELGCASGDNLIPIAAALPNARFVGADFSARQIQQGLTLVDTLGLRNIELHLADIGEIDSSWGHFDFIVCHGIYSWVPPTVRDKILAVCKANLAPDGVAYVSYNTLPGWHTRGMVREMMLYHITGAQTAPLKVQQSRALLQFLAQSAAPNTVYSMALRQELESIANEPDAYVFHDHLEEVNEAVYFHQFAGAAGRNGLQYLAEANFSQMLLSQFPVSVAETLRRIAPDVIRVEQYIDFLRNRSFRQTLLVHQAVSVNRELNGQAVTNFYIATPGQFISTDASLLEGQSERFRSPNGATIATSNAVTKAALKLMALRWPLGFRFRDLLEAAHNLIGDESPTEEALARYSRVLANDILQMYSADAIEFRVRPPAIAIVPSARPIASPVARLQADRGLPITNLRHEPVTLDAYGSKLLCLLDGKRDREALVAEMAKATRRGDFGMSQPSAGSGQSIEQIVRQTMERSLQLMARSALLLAEST